MKDINLSGLLAGEYCQSCKSHRLSLTDDLMISCKDCCEEHSFAPILLVEYQTVCRDLLEKANAELLAAIWPLIDKSHKVRFAEIDNLEQAYNKHKGE